jgi:type I restriction enzyme S subunit
LFENLLIPLPPLSEQKKIAYILSIVQEAKEKTEDVIKATKELKKSMMKYLFTYGPVSLEEVEKVPLKETEIGLIPEEWEVVRLGDLVKSKNIIIQFGFPCGKWNDKGLGVPHLRPFNVSNDGQVVLNGLKFINIERDINRYLLKKGDILFNNTNSEELVGKTAYWNKDGDFVLSNHMTIIRVLNFNLINSQFLANYLHKKWYDGFYLKICRRHVNQASISLARLEQIQIPLPPLSEQKKIASILSAIDQKIEAEENKKKSLEDLFKSLLHNLMTAKIRVNHLENVFDE